MIVASKPWIDDKRWDEIGAYLARPHSLLVGDRVRRELLDEWQLVADLESRLEDALLIGLVGGTGVGKSTLINALAAAEISRSSDRRPTTDRVVVYMHREADLPAELPTENFSVPYVVHRRSTLAKVILLDFPDFDSADTSHAEILRRFLPHLDVLLVVVDDMKYGDRKLYDVLGTLEIDPTNLFLVLNKLDRLVVRYGPRATAVSQEILADLRQNTQRYANLVVPAGQDFALSAAASLAARAAKEETDQALTGLPAEAGEFARLFQLIESYQQAKRRRLAKEKNIDVRKSQVVELLAKEGLSPANRTMLAELEQIVSSADDELEGILQTIPSELFSDRDRRAWRQPRLRAAARQWGIPVSLVLTLFAEIARWRGSSRETRAQFRPRAERHYRAYLDAARNVHQRFDAERCAAQSVEDAEKTVLAAVDTDAAWTNALGQSVAVLSHDQLPQRNGWSWLAHVPALLVVVGILTSKLLATSNASEEIGVMRWLWNGLTMLNPWFLLNLALSVVLVYFVTGAVIWLREIHRLDRDIADAEFKVRSAVRERGRGEVIAVRQQFAELKEEFTLLKRLADQ